MLSYIFTRNFFFKNLFILPSCDVRNLSAMGQLPVICRKKEPNIQSIFTSVGIFIRQHGITTGFPTGDLKQLVDDN